MGFIKFEHPFRERNLFVIRGKRWKKEKYSQHYSLYSWAESNAGRGVLHSHDVSVVVAVNLYRHPSCVAELIMRSGFLSSFRYISAVWIDDTLNLILYVISSSCSFLLCVCVCTCVCVSALLMKNVFFKNPIRFFWMCRKPWYVLEENVLDAIFVGDNCNILFINYLLIYCNSPILETL